MAEGIAWAYEDDSVEQAALIMERAQVRRLPVVDRDKRLVGIMALGDFAVESSEIRPAAEALSDLEAILVDRNASFGSTLSLGEPLPVQLLQSTSHCVAYLEPS